MMKKLFCIITVLLAIVACTDKEFVQTEDTETQKTGGDVIRIGGVEAADLEVSVHNSATRAGLFRDAETVDWLVGPLMTGLDITYGELEDRTNTERVALLTLLPNGSYDATDPSSKRYLTEPTTGWAMYSLTYKGAGKKDGDPAQGDHAIWYDNGPHFFEGVYVPEQIRYGSAFSGTQRANKESVNNFSAPKILTDQSKDGDTDNYTLLSRYLAMPANTHIYATIGRVKLPFRHRMARVLAYVLIDPEMGTGVKLKGFDLNEAGFTVGKDNAATTSIRFCDVEVLEGVDDVNVGDLTHKLTPSWTTSKKVIPHFCGMYGSKDGVGNDLDNQFIMYYDDETATYIFPTDPDWKKYHDMTDSEFAAETSVTKTVYGLDDNGKVPVYDLIVRPTYTSVDSVMYDENITDNNKVWYKTHKNHIEFELTLNNGLIYTKEVDFDLDANYQTVIYLRISRESVNYNAAGSALWVEASPYNDDWYGVDNRLEHSLSFAGSSWQRAFIAGETVSGDKVTDGGFYNEVTDNDSGNDGTDGQYLTDATWIKKFAQAYQGGAHHGDYFALKKNITIDATLLPDDFVFTGHLDAQGHKITLTNTGTDWDEWIVAETDDYASDKDLFTDKDKSKKFVMPALYRYIPAVKFTQAECGEENAKHLVDYVKPAVLYVEGDEIPEGKSVGDVKTPAVIIKKDEEGYVKTYETDYHPLTTEDIKRPEYYESVTLTRTEFMSLTEELYTRSGEDGSYEYAKYTTKPTVLYKVVEHTSGTALFAGLNGNYTTKQEEDSSLPANKWEANVHHEKYGWVPYKNESSGWRAEVLNLVLKGAPLFKADAVVTGNVQNCFLLDAADKSSEVEDIIPDIPQYNN